MSRPLAFLGVILVTLLALSACTGTERGTSDPGLHLGLRVSGAQLLRGGLQENEGGPSVSLLQRPRSLVRRGEANVPLKGRLSPGGIAVHLQLQGDPDRWVLPATVFDFAFPEELLWSAQLEFSSDIQTQTPTASAIVLVQAVDRDGIAGPARSVDFTLAAEPAPSLMSIALAWDRPADLDLIVTLPDGTSIGPKNLNSADPPAPGQPIEEPSRGARLDFDSNQGCVIDGRQVERALWQGAPPMPGVYTVFAQLFSACGQTSVNFEVLVHERGEVTHRAASVLFPFDARMQPPSDGAPGLRMLRFEVP